MTLDIIATLQTVSLIGLFLWMVLYGLLFFIPILPPYELVLLTIGYAMSVGEMNILFPFIAVVLAATAVDSVFFSLTKQGSSYVQKYVMKYGTSTIKKYEKRLKEHYLKSFIILYFIPKIRLFASVISGSTNISWKRFLPASLLSSGIVAAFYICLGYFFNQTIRTILQTVQGWQHLLFYLVMIIVALLIFFGINWFVQRK